MNRSAYLTVTLAICAALLGVSVTSRVAAQDGDPAIEVREFDRVILRSGEEFTGEIYDENALNFWLRLENGSRKFAMEDVLRIDRRNPPEDAYEARRRRTDSDDPAALRALAEFCLQYDLHEPAVQHLERVTKLDPGASEVYGQLLELYRRTPDIQKTAARRDAEIAVCRRAIRNGVTDANLHYRVVRLVELAGDQDMAVYLLRRMLELPDDVIADVKSRVRRDLIRLLVALGRTGEAREEAATETPEDQSEAGLELQKARWQLEAVAAGDEGAPEKFQEHIDNALSIDPNLADAHLLRGCFELLRDDFDAAKKSFTAAMSQGASGAPLDLSYALNFARQGEAKYALDLIARSRNVPGAQELSKLIRAYLHENAGEGDVAWELIREAVAEDGASWQTWLVYLQALRRFEPDADLRPAAEHFLSMFGHNSVAFSECAVLLGDDALDRGEPAEARRWLAYAAQTDPDDFELLLRAGCAELGDGGDLRRARVNLEKAQEHDPRDLDLRNALGCLEYRSGNFAEARRWFQGVVDQFPEEQQEASEPEARLAYALRGLQQVSGVLDEELWVDSFDREGERILNNWTDQQTFGIKISLSDGKAVFDGQQKFEDDGLTVLHRPLEVDDLSRFRVRMRLVNGGERTRVALRIEDKTGTEGIVFYRDLDGVLAFAENSRSKFEEHRPPEPKSDPNPEGQDGGEGEGDRSAGDEEEKDPFDMKRVVWETDGEWHTLEIRLDPERSGKADLYFDGVRVAREVGLPTRSRAGLRLGVSGQAALGGRYRLEIDDFEIFRRRPSEEGSSRR